jgi:hypothetical protein
MNEHVMLPNQYHPSAYNSTSIYQQRVSTQQQGILEKLRKRGQKMPYSKANNSVATTAFDEGILSSINSEKELGDLYWNHRKMEPFTPVRWVKFYLFLDMMAWATLYFAYPIVILISLSLIFNDGGIKRAFLHLFEMSLYTALPALIIKVPLWLLGRKGNISKKQLLAFVRKQYCLNREIGMVTLYGKGNNVIFEHPFIEFDCILASNPTHQGLVNYRLMLVHRYSNYSEGVNIGNMVGMNAPVAEYHRVWNMIQRYMDVSQPLPEVPMLEPFRELDPTTVEFDKLSKRDPRYWRDMTEAQFKAEVRKISVEQEEQNIPASGPVIDIFAKAS